MDLIHTFHRFSAFCAKRCNFPVFGSVAYLRFGRITFLCSPQPNLLLLIWSGHQSASPGLRIFYALDFEHNLWFLIASFIWPVNPKLLAHFPAYHCHLHLPLITWFTHMSVSHDYVFFYILNILQVLPFIVGPAKYFWLNILLAYRRILFLGDFYFS